MKHTYKIGLILMAMCLSTTAASAQSFQISNVIAPYFKDEQYHAQLYIKNLSSTEKNLKVTAILEQVKPNDESYFCVGINCYPPTVKEVTYTIGANTTDSLIAYLTPSTTNGSRTVRYVFSDVDNPTDKVEHTFFFNVGTSVSESPYGNFASISSPSPNPAIETTTIQYSIPESARGSVELYSTDGKLLKTFTVAGANSSLVIPTQEYTPGTYFYALVIDGKKVAAHQLIITR